MREYLKYFSLALIVIAGFMAVVWWVDNKQKLEDNNIYKADEDFLKWLSGKEFTSIGIDKSHYYSDGSMGSPSFPLTIQFDGDKVKYQNCSPTSYVFYKISGGYKISFTPDCTKGDNIELHINLENESYLVKSQIYNIERASNNNRSALAKLDEAVRGEIADGPFMTITRENIKIAGSKPKLVYDVPVDSATVVTVTDTVPYSVIEANIKKEYYSLDFKKLRVDTLPYDTNERSRVIVYSKSLGDVAMIKLVNSDVFDLGEYYFKDGTLYFIHYVNKNELPKEVRLYIQEGESVFKKIEDGKIVPCGYGCFYGKTTTPYVLYNKYISLLPE